MTTEKKDEFLRDAKEILERLQGAWSSTFNSSEELNDFADDADGWLKAFAHEQLFVDKQEN